MNPICQALIDQGTAEVHYMASAVAMANIVKEGFLPFNALQRRSVVPASLANPGVQSRRAARKIVNISLHEFVPFYFATHTPMQFEIEHRDGFDSDDLVIADLSVQVIGKQARLIYFSNENAARGSAEFFELPEHLDRIDWHVVKNARKCSSYKRKGLKAAELLVYEKIAPSCITRLVCRSGAARGKMLALLGGPHPPVEIDPERYFR